MPHTILLVLAGLLSLSACKRATDSGTTEPAAPASNASAGNASAGASRTAPAMISVKPRETDWFEDVTRESGVEFTYRNGVEGGEFTVLETVGGGVAVVDYDADGDLDLFFPGGGWISRGDAASAKSRVGGRAPGLFRNDGDWRFTAVAEASHLVGPGIATGDYTHGASVADYNCDGFPDLFVTAYGRCRLFQNRGDGTFEDASESTGASFVGWSTAAAWGDINGDGFADLYVGQYLDWSPDREAACQDVRGRRDVCPPQRYPPAADRLLISLGDGRFQDQTRESGLRDDGRALGAVTADLDGDGRVDIYVANDAGANFLYLGNTGWPLVDSALTAGVAFQEFGLPEGSMGVDLGDYDGDGRADLWVTNFELEDNSLYQGETSGLFRHATVAAGLAGACFSQVGFGTGFADWDGDGRLDLFVLNGHVYYGGGQTSYAQPAFLFRNRDGGRFENVTRLGGPYFSVPHPGRGAAVADLDNDGDSDLVMVHQNEPVTLLRNRNRVPPWIGLRLRGIRQNPDAIGAIVRAAAGERTWTRWVRGGAGYLSQFDPRILLPAPEPLDIEVTWPGGRRELFSQLAPGRTHDLLEGTGRSPAAPPPPE